MRTFTTALALLALLGGGSGISPVLAAPAAADDSNNSTTTTPPPPPPPPSRLSTWMALSIISRSQGLMTGTGGSAEPLMAGFTQKALAALAAQYPDDADAAAVADYARRSADSVAPFMADPSRDAAAYPLDRLSAGDALLGLSEGATTLDARGDAARALRASIDLNRRNPEGGLWYFTYPNWSYLDGMYSLGPFYALYPEPAASAAITAARDDLRLQFDLLWRHNRNATTGLLVHGYDASRTASWADPVTGASPIVWGRSLGWYAMALVDTVEALTPGAGEGQEEGEESCPTRDHLLELYRSLAPALLEAADPATGGWWQVVDQGGREGNYIESSGSAMFAYALLKGARLGYLPDAHTSLAYNAGTRAQRYLADEFVIREPNGTLSYNGTVAVCSLNSTATYDYYVNQPMLFNSVHGSAAFILASLEVERNSRQRG